VVDELIADIDLVRRSVLGLLLLHRAARMLAGQRLPPCRTGADATATVRGQFRLRMPRGEWLFDDMSFVFV